jgi:peptidoglycan/xylan/chitin deacetylase (PgdA/CDA1 family)
MLAAAAVAIILLASPGESGHSATAAAVGGVGGPPPVTSAPVAGAGARHSRTHLPPIPHARPGVARVYLHGRSSRPEVALTFDDGYCASCVARIIRTLARTGAHATIFPNGRYATSWDPQAATIRRLVAARQLLVGNHTFQHRDARLESPATFQADLGNDESWIERTFGVTSRPFFRPPYGAFDRSTLSVAGRAGYTKVIIWSGTVADSSPRSVGYILDAIRHWARPGAIILMHANYPSTSLALPQILTLLRERGLRPVTLKELLG